MSCLATRIPEAVGTDMPFSGIHKYESDLAIAGTLHFKLGDMKKELARWPSMWNHISNSLAMSAISSMWSMAPKTGVPEDKTQVAELCFRNFVDTKDKTHQQFRQPWRVHDHFSLLGRLNF